MKIVLCIKQVPDTSDIKWTENNTINRDGVESILNPADLYAIETALNIKDINNAEISVVSMGPPQAKDIIKYAIALGCDKGYLLSDKKFAGADTYATSKTIAYFIKKQIPDFDLILCGQFASDGDTAQTGPELAKQLNIPVITYANNIKISSDKFIVKRETESAFETYDAKLPILLCIKDGNLDVRRPLINGFKKANRTEIKILGCEDIDLNAEETGLKGSPTCVSRAFTPKISHAGEIILNENISDTINILKEKIREFSDD